MLQANQRSSEVSAAFSTLYPNYCVSRSKLVVAANAKSDVKKSLPPIVFRKLSVRQPQHENSASTSNECELGSLMVRLELITTRQRDRALASSKATGVFLGSLLIAQGAITKHELEIGIQAQSMLKDKLVDEETLFLALPYLTEQSQGLEGALKRIKWYRDSSLDCNRLGDLLADANAISKLSLVKVLNYKRRSLQPAGETLVLLGLLSRRTLNQALWIQKKVRSGSMQRNVGLERIRQLAFSQKFQSDFEIAGPTRLGDLAAESGILNEEQIEFASMIARWKLKPIGEVLVELNLLSNDQLQAILESQRLLRLGVISRDQSIGALMELESSGSFVEAFEQSIVRASDKHLRQSKVFLALMTQCYSQFKPLISQLNQGIEGGCYTLEQAMHIFSICLQDDCSIRQALEKTKWTIRVNLKSRD
jgi:hypothetical protein